jgi:hypothetical protein
MPLLLADAASGAIDVVVHIGDAAYDLDSNSGATGDAFMVQIEPLAAHLPYMICPGNHESANDFYEYRMRLGAGMPAAKSPSAGGNGTFSSFVSHFDATTFESSRSPNPLLRSVVGFADSGSARYFLPFHVSAECRPSARSPCFI